MPTPRAVARFAVVLVAGAVISACGGGDATSPSKPALTPQEAKTVAVAILQEISRALGDSTGFSASRRPSAVRALRAPAFSSMPSFTTSVSSSCSKGGTLSGTLTLNDNTNSVGTGTVTETMAVTPHGCVVSTGTRDIAVNGQINLGLSLTLANNEPTSDIVEQVTGKLTWDGGSCDLNYAFRLTLQGALVMSGTVCGESVDGSVGL